MTDLEPSLAFTANQGWHLTGGLAEQVIRERDEARQQRDHYQRQAVRKGEAMNFDEALEALVSEAESLGLTRQAEKAQKALDDLREAVRVAGERDAAMAEVRAAEEALRIAREKAGLLAEPRKRGPKTGQRLNLSPEERERRRQQAYAMQARRVELRAQREAEQAVA